VGVDHLILATIDHPAAGELLAKEGINAAALRDRVSAGISATPSTDPQSDFLTEPTKQFQAVIEQAKTLVGDRLHITPKENAISKKLASSKKFFIVYRVMFIAIYQIFSSPAGSTRGWKPVQRVTLRAYLPLQPKLCFRHIFPQFPLKRNKCRH